MTDAELQRLRRKKHWQRARRTYSRRSRASSENKAGDAKAAAADGGGEGGQPEEDAAAAAAARRCPLGLAHAPSGTEFSLGCAKCRAGMGGGALRTPCDACMCRRQNGRLR